MMKFEIYILQKKSQDPKMYQEAMGEYLKRLGVGIARNYNFLLSN